MIYTDNCQITHIPKTGGIYLRELLNSNDVNSRLMYMMTNDKNPYTFAHELVDSRADENHHLPDNENKAHRIMIVRNPLTWYMSYFTHRNDHKLGTMGGWSPYRDFDRKCMSADFDTFMEKVFRAYPAPFLSQLYVVYKNVCRVTHIVHMEDLFKEIEPIINKAEGVELKYLDKRVNSRPHQRISPEMLERIAQYESQTIEGYYGESSPS